MSGTGPAGIRAVGLEVVPALIATLDKGQRSVKGLASGFENVAKLDLMLTLRPGTAPGAGLAPASVAPTSGAVEEIIRFLLRRTTIRPRARSISNSCADGFRLGWDLSKLTSQHSQLLRSADQDIDRRSGLSPGPRRFRSHPVTTLAI